MDHAANIKFAAGTAGTTASVSSLLVGRATHRDMSFVRTSCIYEKSEK